jgi:hypothetical protein
VISCGLPNHRAILKVLMHTCNIYINRIILKLKVKRDCTFNPTNYTENAT